MTIVSPNTLIVGPGQFESGQGTGQIDPTDMQRLIDSLAGQFQPTPKTASYTAALVDKGTVVEMNLTGTAHNFTIPPNSTAAFDIGTMLGVRQIGTGVTTVVAGAGVTIQLPSPMTLVLRAQWSTAYFHKRGTNEWVGSGDLT